MRGRRSGSWERVEAARRQARLAQGRDPAGGDPYGSRPKARSPLPAAPRPTWVAHGPAVGVLTITEAALRLRMGRDELDAMLSLGKVETVLVGGFTRMISTREIERLLQLG